MSVNLDQVIAEVKQLPPEQQRELRNRLDDILAETARPADKLKRILIEDGLLTEVKPDSSDPDEDDFIPIEVSGKPVSETIIEERR